MESLWSKVDLVHLYDLQNTNNPICRLYFRPQSTKVSFSKIELFWETLYLSLYSLAETNWDIKSFSMLIPCQNFQHTYFNNLCAIIWLLINLLSGSLGLDGSGGRLRLIEKSKKCMYMGDTCFYYTWYIKN